MRAHSQRRLIWFLNVVLGLGVLALLAWIFLDVRPATADAAYLKPKWAVAAVEGFKNTPPTNRSALRPPVSQTELEEVDRPEFRVGKDRFHWLYSGPMPPPPPEPAEVEEVQAPVEDDLSKLGHVAMLIYICPGDGQDSACETVVYWEFPDKDRVAFSPGEFIRKRDEKAKGGIKLVDVKPVAGGDRIYELHYEVYAKDDQPATKSGVYRYDGNKELPAELAARIKEKRPGAGTAAAQDGEAGGRTSGGVTQPAGTQASGSTPTALDASRINPTVKYETQNQANVTFDQGTYDYFKKTDPDSIAKTVKTQVARDSQGKVIGLQITGISKETPADRFDVKPGDILVSIDDQPVKSRSDAMNIVQGLDPNTRLVKVVIDRRGRLITFNIDPTDPKTRRAARALDNR